MTMRHHDLFELDDMLSEMACEYSADRCECGGELTAELVRPYTVGIVCTECGALYDEVSTDDPNEEAMVRY